MLTINPNLLPHFKGYCSSPSVIMLFVYMKFRFSLSYRDLKEMIMIRGANIDHSNKDMAEEDKIEIRQVKYLNNIVEQDHLLKNIDYSCIYRFKRVI